MTKQRLKTSHIRPEQFATSRWAINVPAGSTIKDLVSPDFYANIANQLGKNDYIRALFDDGSYIVDLLVTEVDTKNQTPVWIRTVITNVVNIAEAEEKTKEILKQEIKQEKEVVTGELSHPDYEIKFRGAKKYSIIRKNDKAVLQEDLLTKEAANEALKELIAKIGQMTTKLSLYNGALRVLGERKLASLSEDRLPRRLLDDVWDDGAVDYCLGQGDWTFATRTQMLEASNAIDPDFGYQYAFEKGSDWVETIAICSDEYFQNGILRYSDETDIIYCDLDTIYVKFTSNNSSYGGDYSLWPETFIDYVETYLASQICRTLQQKDFDEKKLERVLREAKNKDMKRKPPQVLPLGVLASSRLGRAGRYYSGTGNFSV